MGHSFKVSADQADRRLDRVLRSMYSGVPLGAVMKALRKGEVRVDGRKSTIDHRLVEGEAVTVPWSPEEAVKASGAQTYLPHPHGVHGRLTTLFRSKDILCVDKPAGLLSQPDRRGGDSLITRVWADLSWERDDFRPAAISRLDRNVSGVVVVALNAPILRALSSLMRDGKIGKNYTALVCGSTPDEGEINSPLSKDESQNMARIDELGLPSLTRYRAVERYRGYTLVSIELVTGRPHQARAHMASIGYPVVGDAKYGKYGRNNGGRGAVCGSRLFLHASRIVLPDSLDLPKELQCTIIESPLPKEFTSFLSGRESACPT